MEVVDPARQPAMTDPDLGLDRPRPVDDANDPTNGTAHLAKCTSFDEDAFAAFFDAFQFQGPERFPADTLLPGRN